MPVCKLCGISNGKLANCHILPQSMTKFLAKPSGLGVTTSIRHGPRVTTGVGGFYDKNIVCNACERLFFEADNHFLEFWRGLVDGTAKAHYPLETHKFRSYAANPAFVHKFVMQTLLRAHLSKMPDCAEFSLGVWEEAVVESVLGGLKTIDRGPEISLRYVRSSDSANMMLPYEVRHATGVETELVLPHMRIRIATAAHGRLHAAMTPSVLTDSSRVIVFHTRRLYPNEVAPLELIRSANRQRVGHIMERRDRSPFVWLGLGSRMAISLTSIEEQLPRFARVE